MKNNHKEDQPFPFWPAILIITGFHFVLIVSAFTYVEYQKVDDAETYATKKYNEAVYNDMILSKTTEASWHEKQSELRPWKR